MLLTTTNHWRQFYRWDKSFFLLRAERVVLHGRADGRHVLFADIRRLRQEAVRAAVAQLSGPISAQSDVLLRHPAACHTFWSSGAHINHAALQPAGVHQDGPHRSGRCSWPEARRAEGKVKDNKTWCVPGCVERVLVPSRQFWNEVMCKSGQPD